MRLTGHQGDDNTLMLSPFTKEDIDERLNQAINRLIEYDGYLLRKDANERSISHRLAMYLQELFNAWDVDCEYNRNLDQVKTLQLPKRLIGWDDTDARTVYPDIIIHHRGTEENLLVIEIKKTTSAEGNSFDKRKLSAFKDELGYHYAVALRFRTGRNDCRIDELEYI